MLKMETGGSFGAASDEHVKSGSELVGGQWHQRKGE